MHYDALLVRLLSVNKHGGLKLGLENCIRMNDALGCPTNNFSAIHVAGTNGKGSVSTKIAAALQSEGLRTGLYTSPHISCFRERIRINGVMISQEKAAAHLAHLFAIVDQQNIPATFFELTTLLAFSYFAAENIDIAVIETGLGGRLDATNIICPKLSIITTISLDHTEILGNSIEEITLEKAGIIKPSTPILIGPRVPIQTIKRVAKDKASECIAIQGSYADFHEENNAIAAAALNHLKVSEESIRKGLTALPPCRLQTWYKNDLSAQFPNQPLPDAVVLDVAHNPDGIQNLLNAVKQRYPDHALRFVLGLSRNKDVAACLGLIHKASDHIHLIEAPNGRAASRSFLYDSLIALGASPSKLSIESSIPQALHHAFTAAGFNNQILIVCGTFFIMADARATLGIQEPRDPTDLN